MLRRTLHSFRPLFTRQYARFGFHSEGFRWQSGSHAGRRVATSLLVGGYALYWPVSVNLAENNQEDKNKQ
jgi:hypothetical protein